MPQRFEEEQRRSRLPLFLRSLTAVLGRAPIWLVTAMMLLILALPAVLPWQDWFAGVTRNRYEPGTLVRSLNETFRFDHRAGLSVMRDSTAQLGAGLAFLAGLLGVFSAGGWLQVILERTHGHTLRRFFFGGSRYFWRFFRFWLVTLAVLGALHWVLYGWPFKVGLLQWILDVPAKDVSELESFRSEKSVRLLYWTRDGLAALGFAFIMTWGVYSRTRLALHDTTSAVWAGLCSFGTILRHPIRTCAPLMALFLVELAIVTGLAGGLAQMLDGRLGDAPSMWGVLWLFLVGQMALLWREVTRGARYYAASEVSRQVVRPLSRPDPWKAIGGPGGPQYPVYDSDDDEYGVSM